MNPIYSIGYWSLEPDEFVTLLQKRRISLVVDVRSHPTSAWQADFNRDNLITLLADNDMDYLYLGDQLGGRPKDIDCAEGWPRHSELRDSPSHQAGIARLLQERKIRILALLCVERDPLSCHRGLHIARSLAAHDVDVRHLLPDGGEQPHSLMLEQAEPPPDMFVTEGAQERTYNKLEDDVISHLRTRRA